MFLGVIYKILFLLFKGGGYVEIYWGLYEWDDEFEGISGGIGGEK